MLGPIEAAARMIRTTPADEAIIAIPSATREQLAKIYAILRRANFARIRIVPQIAQILDGEAHLIQAREIDPEDFLARSPVRVNLRKSLAYVRGKRVLVTGAGGSIGSELCRQLLEGGAERLYLFGHGENSIYEIERELRLLQEEGVGEKATIVPIIGEIQDRDYLHFILSRTRAHVVFHTAAHKHVPLMEANPVEAVKNNVFGTKNIVDASQEERRGALRAHLHRQGGGAQLACTAPRSCSRRRSSCARAGTAVISSSSDSAMSWVPAEASCRFSAGRSSRADRSRSRTRIPAGTS